MHTQGVGSGEGRTTETARARARVKSRAVGEGVRGVTRLQVTHGAVSRPTAPGARGQGFRPGVAARKNLARQRHLLVLGFARAVGSVPCHDLSHALS